MKILKKLIILFIFLSPLLSLGSVKAQDFNLTLPKVTQSGSIKDTEKIGEDYTFNNILTLSDSLRFAWSNIDLDLEAQTVKSPSTGYIKAYINSPIDENFITNFASAPIKLDQFSQKLKEGNNKLYFVLYSNGIATSKKFGFSFVFKATSSDPIIKIVKPNPKIILSNESKYDFQINVENFTVKSGINISNHGKINVYIDQVSEDNLITQIVDSETINSNSVIKFSSNIFGDRIKKNPDSLSSKIIFLPISNTGNAYKSSEVSLEVISNYNNTLDIKQPAIEFINVNDTATIGRDDLIKYKISNFKTLKLDTRNSTNNNEGYLQVLINDKPHKMTYDKTEFTLSELAPNYTQEKVNIKLQLVNTDFSQLNPIVSTNADLFIKETNPVNITDRIQASNWRLIIIGTTIAMILGSVLYIIFRT